jgi:hypothetical protein
VFKNAAASKLQTSYTANVANSVVFMVAEFEDGSCEAIPENWGYRPTLGSGDRPSVAIPTDLDEVRD